MTALSPPGSRPLTELARVGDFRDEASAFEHYAKHVKGIKLGPSGSAKVTKEEPDLPEFSSFGEYREEARKFMDGSAPEAWEGFVDDLIENGYKLSEAEFMNDLRLRDLFEKISHDPRLRDFDQLITAMHERVAAADAIENRIQTQRRDFRSKHPYGFAHN